MRNEAAENKCDCMYCRLSFRAIYNISLDLEDVFEHFGPPANF
jgi:hypothetical protein